MTWDQANGDEPQISFISPSSVVLGSSGSLLIKGTHLTAGCTDQTPTIAVTPPGGGLHVIFQGVVCDDEVDATYTVDSSPSAVGTYGVKVTTTAGSSTANVIVGDPSPSITSIATNGPNLTDFLAGATVSFTVTGNYFGTNPQLNVTGPGITSGSYGITGTPNNTSISGWISAPSPGSASVTVTSRGYNGSNFVSAGGSSAASSAMDVPIDAVPMPLVFLNGQTAQSVANNGTNPAKVVVGQRVRLDVQLPLGVAQQAQAWSGLSQNAIARFDGTAAMNQVTPLLIAYGGNCQTFTESCLVFYFVSAGATGQTSESVTYNYSTSAGPATATVYFTVTGPNAATVSVNTGIVKIENFPGNGLVLAIDGVPVAGGTAGMSHRQQRRQRPGLPVATPGYRFSISIRSSIWVRNLARKHTRRPLHPPWMADIRMMLPRRLTCQPTR